MGTEGAGRRGAGGPEDWGAVGKDRGTVGTAGDSSGVLSWGPGQARGPRRGRGPALGGRGPEGQGWGGYCRRRAPEGAGGRTLWAGKGGAERPGAPGAAGPAWGGPGTAVWPEVLGPWGPPKAGAPAPRQAEAPGPGAPGDGLMGASGDQGRLPDRRPRYLGAETPSWGAGVRRAGGRRGAQGVPGAGEERARGQGGPRTGPGMAEAPPVPKGGAAGWGLGAQGPGATRGPASARRGPRLGLEEGAGVWAVARRPG